VLILAFRDFESDLITILIGVLPSIMARKGIAGRTRVVNAFERYFQAGGHEKASVFMRNRYAASFKHGVPIKDIARYEVGGSLAVLVNTAPSAFWMLLYVFSFPEVLQDIRREIGSILTTATDNTGTKFHSLDITSVKTSCPLLTSTFQEVLRLRSMGTSIRQVMEDTVLDDQWLLKKDCMIQMPSRVIHEDSSIWGTDVDEFYPRRFMKDASHKTETGRPPKPAAFRAFGGGTTLCPGRHFATNEILAVVSMFVMRYDMVPMAGEWTMPDTYNTNVAAVIMEPDTDIDVEISLRQGFEDGKWAFSVKDSEKIFSMVAEDQLAE
jgi:Cytochrome P450